MSIEPILGNFTCLNKHSQKISRHFVTAMTVINYKNYPQSDCYYWTKKVQVLT